MGTKTQEVASGVLRGLVDELGWINLGRYDTIFADKIPYTLNDFPKGKYKIIGDHATVHTKSDNDEKLGTIRVGTVVNIVDVKKVNDQFRGELSDSSALTQTPRLITTQGW